MALKSNHSVAKLYFTVYLFNSCKIAICSSLSVIAWLVLKVSSLSHNNQVSPTSAEAEDGEDGRPSHHHITNDREKLAELVTAAASMSLILVYFYICDRY